MAVGANPASGKVSARQAMIAPASVMMRPSCTRAGIMPIRLIFEKRLGAQRHERRAAQGLRRPNDPRRSDADSPEQRFRIRRRSLRAMFDVNFFGTVRATQAFLPLVRAPRSRGFSVSAFSPIMTLISCGGWSGRSVAVVPLSRARRRQNGVGDPDRRQVQIAVRQAFQRRLEKSRSLGR